MMTSRFFKGTITGLASIFLMADVAIAEMPNTFSDDYGTARGKFLDAAKTAGAQTEGYKHPKAGPNGTPIYTDVAVLGPQDAKFVLFVGSGTHGVEGFAGSAIQTGLLRNGIESQLGPDTRLVLIHAINPYGFAHLRRVNEDNIDLNRNFRNHGKPHPANPGYDKLSDSIAPSSISLLSDTWSISKMLIHMAGNGYGATKTAITAGQYKHPQGLFYGGTSEAWSVKTLREIVRRYGSGAQKAAFIGIHTGLGPYAQAEIILNSPKDTPAYKNALGWWGEMVKTTKTDESVSSDLMGTLKLAIPDMLSEAEVTAVSLEFGTVSSFKALLALRAENWLQHHGGTGHPEADQIKSDLLRAFYPDADDWRTAILQKGEKVINRALHGLSEK